MLYQIWRRKAQNHCSVIWDFISLAIAVKSIVEVGLVCLWSQINLNFLSFTTWGIRQPTQWHWETKNINQDYESFISDYWVKTFEWMTFPRRVLIIEGLNWTVCFKYNTTYVRGKSRLSLKLFWSQNWRRFNLQKIEFRLGKMTRRNFKLCLDIISGHFTGDA